MNGKLLFRAAALFNIMVGLGFLLGRSVLVLLAHLDPVTGTNVLITNIAALLILTCGLVYAVIAADTVRYRPMILIGIIGKSLAVAAALQFL